MLRTVLIAALLLCSCGVLDWSRSKDGTPPDSEMVWDGGDLDAAVALLELAAEIDKAVEEDRLLQNVPLPTVEVYTWPWESPDGTKPKILEVTQDQREDSTATALLRVCTSEAGFENINDCTAIWEVMQNIRSARCSRDLYPQITRCDERGETEASALRRLQRVVLGSATPRNRRTRWIHSLELDCRLPKGYPSPQHWRAAQARNCLRLARFSRHVAAGGYAGRVTQPAQAIAWGGRCEVKAGACDDAIACARGLARIPDTDTANAFWCRVGSRNCRQSPEPVCLNMGFRYVFDNSGQRRTVRSIHDPRRGPWKPITDLGDPGRIDGRHGGLRLGRPDRGSRVSQTLIATRELEALPRQGPEARPVLDETQPIGETHGSSGGLER